MNIDSAELQYELAWSRFDLLINNKEADSFLSREEVRVYFLSLFDQFQQLEPILVEAKTGSSVAASQFYRETQNLYMQMIDYVTLHFRVASPSTNINKRKRITCCKRNTYCSVSLS